MAARIPPPVLEQVHESALELRGVGVDQRQVGVDGQSEGVGVPSPTSSAADRISSSIEHHSRRGSGRPGLQPREVEQLVDEPGQAARLLTDALAKLLALLGS